MNVELELEKELKPFANNEDFVIGVLTIVEHDDDKKKLLNFITTGDNVSSNSIIELAYHLRCTRDGDPEYKARKTSFSNGWPD